MECAGKLLLLQRAPKKLFPGTWAIPGGKLEKGETALEALLREIREELCLSPSEEELRPLSSPYVRHSLMDYRLHLFHWPLVEVPKIALNSHEHQAFQWQPISAFRELPLLEGQFEAFSLVYSQGASSEKKRSTRSF